jgi:hypothetical protein
MIQTSTKPKVLFFHQSPYIPTLDQHLICPEQCRHNQVTVNETPLMHLSFDIDPSTTTQSLQPTPDLHIPLELNGDMVSLPQTNQGGSYQ